MTTHKINKQVDSVVDYEINWLPKFSESSPIDAISTSTWTVNGGLTVDSDTNTTTTSKVWLSGGTNRKYAEAVNEVVTTGGRTYYDTVILRMLEA
jgi:hypothetical protein